MNSNRFPEFHTEEEYEEWRIGLENEYERRNKMFLVKCLVCGKSCRIKVTHEHGRPKLTAFDPKEEKANIIISTTIHEDITINCLHCMNEVRGE